MARYLVRRSGVWHYRRRVPEDVLAHVAKEWWKLSLKTANLREAEVRALALAVQHDQLIAGVRQQSGRQRLAALAELDTAYFEDDRMRFSRQHQTVAHGILKTEQSALDEHWPVAQRRLSHLTEAERALLERKGGVDGLIAAVRAESRATIESTDDIEREVRAQHLAQKQSILSKLGYDSYWLERNADPNNPTIDIAVEQWFTARKQGASAVKRHQVAVRRFIELHGNLCVRDVNRGHVVAYLASIARLADHRRLPTDLRGGLADAADVPRVAAPTVYRHLTSIKALLHYCAEQSWIQASPAVGVRGPVDLRPKAAKRRSFTRDERIQLLERAIEEYGEDGDMTWLIRLGAYTGARLEELAQLARSNIRMEDGVWVVEFDDLDGRTIKSKTSVRLVPLHPAIRASFVSWVKSGKGDRVFMSFLKENGRYANRLSGEFGRLMDRAMLTDTRLVFHSLRHTLKREMSHARIDPDVRRAILGHAAKDAHDGYEGYGINSLAEEYAKLPLLF